MKRLLVFLCLGAALLCMPRGVDAASAESLFQRGSKALVAGKFEEAIGYFELLADSHPSHPDASYNRGLAYLSRVRSGAERDGDLGRAAAAFEEALLMRPSDAEARQARDLVHGEVARRRARRGKDVLLARPSLDREVMGLLSERGWALVVIVGSLLGSLGWVLRRREKGAVQLTGMLLVPMGLLMALLSTPLYLGARTLRLERRPGVLVVTEAHLTDDRGVIKPGEPLPEGAFLELGARQGRLIEVRYGSTEGWLPSGTVRVLRLR